jgi:hypothetical protein
VYDAVHQPRIAPEVGLKLSLLFVFLLVAPAWAGDVFFIPPGFADGLLGHAVRILPDGKPPENIGRVIDVLVNTEGQPVAAVLDVGGFLGVGNRKVAVTWPSLQFAPAKDGLTITLALDAESIRSAPDYKGPAKPVQAVSP